MRRQKNWHRSFNTELILAKIMPTENKRQILRWSDIIAEPDVKKLWTDCGLWTFTFCSRRNQKKNTLNFIMIELRRFIGVLQCLSILFSVENCLHALSKVANHLLTSCNRIQYLHKHPIIIIMGIVEGKHIVECFQKVGRSTIKEDIYYTITERNDCKVI